MKAFSAVVALSLWSFLATVSTAAEYGVQGGSNPPPQELAKEIADQLSPKDLKITKGTGDFAQVWLRKEWDIQSGFQPTNEILYPFQNGELIGAVKFARRFNDFRNQEVPPGIYTLRFALQPQDGNHIGTSETRDFLVLVKAADDTTAAPIELQKLFKLSAEAAESTHPAMMALRNPAAHDGDLPSVVHDEEAELWVLRFGGTSKGGKPGEQRADLVIVGRAKE